MYSWKVIFSHTTQRNIPLSPLACAQRFALASVKHWHAASDRQYFAITTLLMIFSAPALACSVFYFITQQVHLNKSRKYFCEDTNNWYRRVHGAVGLFWVQFGETPSPAEWVYLLVLRARSLYFPLDQKMRQEGARGSEQRIIMFSWGIAINAINLNNDAQSAHGDSIFCDARVIFHLAAQREELIAFCCCCTAAN